MSALLRIYPATSDIDQTIANHFYQLWLDNNVPGDLIYDDWLNITLKFIQNARHNLKF